MPKKLTYEQVKVYFETEGYNLVTKEYLGYKVILKCMCPSGHIFETHWNRFQQGSRCPICRYATMSTSQIGASNPRWKGGVTKQGKPLYETYHKRLEKYVVTHQVIQKDLALLGVECVYCGAVFVPKIKEVEAKFSVIEGNRAGESNLYCSKNCKLACPTYGKHKYPKGFKLATSREVQPELRKLILKRDNYECQLCTASSKDTQLHCHHIDPVSQNPIESADMDNCITLCKECHKQVHTLPDCGYNELKCKRI